MNVKRISERAAAPRYVQLAEQLSQDVRDGLYPVGTCLPTEHRLCELFQVSRFTVRQALSRLRDLGLVSSEHGVGTRVDSADFRERMVLSLGSIAEISDFTRSTEMQILRKALVRPEEVEIDLPAACDGEEWLLVEGLRLARDRALPIALTQIHVSPRYVGIAPRIDPGSLSGPIFALIEEIYGEKVATIRQEISAIAVPETMAAHLRVEPGTPVLRILRHYLNVANLTLQFSCSVTVSERFVYSADIVSR
jgi:GntR family transcriptional regulator